MGAEKDQAAREMGKKGAAAREASMPPKRRVEIAKKAAEKRRYRQAS